MIQTHIVQKSTAQYSKQESCHIVISSCAVMYHILMCSSLHLSGPENSGFDLAGAPGATRTCHQGLIINRGRTLGLGATVYCETTHNC